LLTLIENGEVIVGKVINAPESREQEENNEDIFAKKSSKTSSG